VVDFDKFNPVEEGSTGFVENVIVQELAHAMSVITERVQVFTIKEFKTVDRRRL
jgi:hypothetical protein